MKYKTERISIDQINECVNVFISVFSSVPWSETWSKEKAFARLCDIYNIKRSICLCCKLEDKIVGALFGYLQEWHDGYHYEIREIFVLKEHQNAGCGSAILDELERELSVKRPLKIILQTMRKQDTLLFYNKKGFSINDDEIVLFKNLI